MKMTNFKAELMNWEEVETFKKSNQNILELYKKREDKEYTEGRKLIKYFLNKVEKEIPYQFKKVVIEGNERELTARIIEEEQGTILTTNEKKRTEKEVVNITEIKEELQELIAEFDATRKTEEKTIILDYIKKFETKLQTLTA